MTEKADEGAKPVAIEGDVERDVQPEDELHAKLRGLEKRIGELNKENAKHRHRYKDEVAAREEAMQEQGQYKALAESLKERLADVEGKMPSLEDRAQRWETHQEAESKRIDAAVDRLPDEWKLVVAGTPDLATKANIIRALQQQKSPALPAVPAASSPASNGAEPDVLTMSAGELRAYQERNPEGWKKFLSDQGALGGPKKKTFFG